MKRELASMQEITVLYWYYMYASLWVCFSALIYNPVQLFFFFRLLTESFEELVAFQVAKIFISTMQDHYFIPPTSLCCRNRLGNCIKEKGSFWIYSRMPWKNLWALLMQFLVKSLKNFLLVLKEGEDVMFLWLWS